MALIGDVRVRTTLMARLVPWARRSLPGLLAVVLLAGGGFAGALAMQDGEEVDPRQERQQERRERRSLQPHPNAGPALYPDLQTLPLRDLQFDQLEDQTSVLRFTVEIWNAGEGRVEISAPASDEDGEDVALFQNLYDSAVEGRLAEKRPVAGRVIFHPDHGHWHFANFARYELLDCNAPGECQPVGLGAKVSFCLIDSELEDLDVPWQRQYTVCESSLQGITPGYSDLYLWSLPEQWVVLPDGPLADGEFAVRVTADPDHLLDEGGGEREENNTATAYFTVINGQIGNVRETGEDQPPAATPSPVASSP